MKKIILSMFLLAAVLTSCKKNYTCYCGIDEKVAVFEVKDTKKKADQKCQDYETSSNIASVGGSCETR